MIRTLPIDDRGLTLGVGLFETILAVDGHPFLWEAHAARLQRGCAVLGLPLPEDHHLRDAANRALGNSGLTRGRAAVRLTWTGGSGARGLVPPSPASPRLFATATSFAGPVSAVSLSISRIRRNSTSPTSRLKTLSYLDNAEARRLALLAGSDEALMLNEEGHIACCAAANLFWVEGNTFCTPALETGVLDGTMRAVVLSAAQREGWPLQEVSAVPDRLRQSQGAFITNCLMGAIEVRSLDAVDMPKLQEPVRRLLQSVGTGAGVE